MAGGIRLSNAALLSNGNATADNGIEYSDVRGVTSIVSSDIFGSGVNNDPLRPRRRGGASPTSGGSSC